MPLLVIESSSSWPLGLSWKRSTAAMSSNRKGRSKICSLGVYLANFASDGAMICTSPSSSASISLPSPNNWLFGNTCTSTLPGSAFSASSLNLIAA